LGDVYKIRKAKAGRGRRGLGIKFPKAPAFPVSHRGWDPPQQSEAREKQEGSKKLSGNISRR
jgi:hypothetical protein